MKPISRALLIVIGLAMTLGILTVWPAPDIAHAAGVGIIESAPVTLVCDADGTEIKPTDPKAKVVFWSCQVDTGAVTDAYFGGVGTTSSLYRERKAAGSSSTGSYSAGGYCAGADVTVHCGFGIVGN